jgi:hypothetical protein
MAKGQVDRLQGGRRSYTCPIIIPFFRTKELRKVGHRGDS